MPTNKQLRRTMGYVEFLAHAEEVESLLAQGRSKKLIHECMTEQGHFSMAYVTFCQILQKAADRGLREPKPAKEKKTSASALSKDANQQSASKPLPSSSLRIVNTAKEPFPDPRKMNLEDGI